MLSVNILVQAIVIAFAILKEKGRWLGLPGSVAAREIVVVLGRITHIYSHDFVPAVRQLEKLCIESRSQSPNDFWERIGKIFVFPATEAMPSHEDSGTKAIFIAIHVRQVLAIIPREHGAHGSATVLIQVVNDLRPLKCRHAIRDC